MHAGTRSRPHIAGKLDAHHSCVLIQPAEIHSFVALEEGRHSLTVVGGRYAELRHYFNPADKTCVVRRPRPLNQAAVAAG